MTTTSTSAQKLAQAVRESDEMLAPYRRNRLMFLRQYAGPYYVSRRGGPAAGGAEPLNMIYSVVSVVLPHLVATNPRAMIRTPRAALRRRAEVFALAWNHLAEEIDLSRSLRTVVADALFGVGIMKTGLAPGATVEGVEGFGGYLHDNGQPFADPVDVDDYVIDPQARAREQAAFEGNRYRLPRRYVLESDLFDRSLAERLPAGGQEPVVGSPQRAEELSPGRPGPGNPAEYLELLDLWLPNENVVVTIPADADGPQGFLREAAWEGPERGPYEMLGFHWVPNNVLPVPPVGLIFDLHVMVNKVARKLARQADRQKDLILFDERTAEEAEKIRDALDGQMVGVQNVDRYKQVGFGGAGEEGYRHLAFLFEQFSRIGGNTDLLGGLAPQSETLGQDEMLYAGASVRVEDMRSQVYRFTKHVGGKLAWYLWYDPLIDLPLIKPAPGGGQEQVTFSWRDREGDFLDYNFDIEPHSMSPDTPARKYRRVIDWIQRVILPTAGIAAAQGLKLDVSRLARITGRMLNIEEAPDLFVQDSRE